MGKTHMVSLKALPENPLVSVLMPAYNAEKFITEAIISILDQDHSNWELLILDDGSTDSTPAIIGSFSDPRIKFFQHSSNKGYLISCNELFQLAEGDLITFQDADDLCHSNRLSSCVFEFEKDPKLGFVTTDHERIGAMGRSTQSHQVDIDYKRMSSDPDYEVYFACATLFFRAELLKMVEGYHPFFKGIGGEDYHMIWELSRVTTGKHLSEPLYCYRIHEFQNQFTMKDPLKHLMMVILKDLKAKAEKGLQPLENWESYKDHWYRYAENNTHLRHLGEANLLMRQGFKAKALLKALKAVLNRPQSRSTWITLRFIGINVFSRG